MIDYGRYADTYFKNLFEDVLPFWQKNSPDFEHGGFFTCLDSEGKIYDTDKFVWLQCRQVWTFSMLYNKVRRNEEWLNLAIHGAEFLKKHGLDSNGNWYFSLTRDGKPLVQPYNIFSDCFATMAFGQLYQATGKEEYAQIAINTFYNILRKKSNPKGIYSKTIGQTRALQNFALPMILCNLVLEIEPLVDRSVVEKTIHEGIDLVMNTFFQKDIGLILENVTLERQFSNSFEGRLVNPGHGIEAMWFIMDLAERTNNIDLIRKAKDITLKTISYAWDKEHGGIFYFMDVKGYPPQQLEWDQKLWWVHIEALVSLLKGSYHTADPECLVWFAKLHEYTWSHFPDKINGEWFGYLNRQGEVLLPLKGGKWKGCFHVPRGLFQCWKMLQKMEQKEESVQIQQ